MRCSECNKSTSSDTIIIQLSYVATCLVIFCQLVQTMCNCVKPLLCQKYIPYGPNMIWWDHVNSECFFYVKMSYLVKMSCLLVSYVFGHNTYDNNLVATCLVILPIYRVNLSKPCVIMSNYCFVKNIYHLVQIYELIMVNSKCYYVKMSCYLVKMSC